MAFFFFLIGPSGSGKTTIASKIKKRFHYKIIEADNFHSTQNISLMKKGIKLSNADRLPWLRDINKILKVFNQSNKKYIISCSALKKSYRKILAKNLTNFFFLYLKCKKTTLIKRISSRKHFFPLSLLNDQLKNFELSNDLLIINSNSEINIVVKNVYKKIDSITKKKVF